MKPIEVKKALKRSIHEISRISWLYSVRPGKDNTRTRKLPFEKNINAVLAFRGGTLNKEIREFFGVGKSMPTASAFIQQRSTILPEAFNALFHMFTDSINTQFDLNAMRIFAVDGTVLESAGYPDDPDSYFAPKDGKKPYNLHHINAMYDLENHIFMDALIQGVHEENEQVALVRMVDRSHIRNALVIADRGYESYNCLAHIQEKGWFFLFRIRNTMGIASGLSLPQQVSFDVPFSLNLTRCQSAYTRSLDRNQCKILKDKRFDFLPVSLKTCPDDVFYNLPFRIVRFPISDSVSETIITNLDPVRFPLLEIKRLYALRWGVETAFREIKYTIGLRSLHAKKVELVLQEIFAKLIMFNFCQAITLSVILQQKHRKLSYSIAFADAAHICLQFFLQNLSPPYLEGLLARFIVPVRPSRNIPRKLRHVCSVPFSYRLA